MARDLTPFEQRTLKAIDDSHQRFLQASLTADILWEIGNQLSLWSSLRGFHTALLGDQVPVKGNPDA